MFRGKSEFLTGTVEAILQKPVSEEQLLATLRQVTKATR